MRERKLLAWFRHKSYNLFFCVVILRMFYIFSRKREVNLQEPKKLGIIFPNCLLQVNLEIFWSKLYSVFQMLVRFWDEFLNVTLIFGAVKGIGNIFPAPKIRQRYHPKTHVKTVTFGNALNLLLIIQICNSDFWL